MFINYVIFILTITYCNILLWQQAKMDRPEFCCSISFSGWAISIPPLYSLIQIHEMVIKLLDKNSTIEHFFIYIGQGVTHTHTHKSRAISSITDLTTSCKHSHISETLGAISANFLPTHFLWMVSEEEEVYLVLAPCWSWTAALYHLWAPHTRWERSQPGDNTGIRQAGWGGKKCNQV